MEDLIVPISGLPPAGTINGTEILAIVQGGVTSRVPLSGLPAFFGSIGMPITNSGLQSSFRLGSNWKDSYGNNADLGGKFNPSIDLSSQNAGDYFLDLPTGLAGEVKFIYQILVSGSTKTAIRTLYFS